MNNKSFTPTQRRCECCNRAFTATNARNRTCDHCQLYEAIFGHREFAPIRAKADNDGEAAAMAAFMLDEERATHIVQAAPGTVMLSCDDGRIYEDLVVAWQGNKCEMGMWAPICPGLHGVIYHDNSEDYFVCIGDRCWSPSVSSCSRAEAEEAMIMVEAAR